MDAGIQVTASGRVLCFDCDQDGLREFIFSTITGITPPIRWEVWEYRPVNRYELVFADTGAYPYPPGIATGNLAPFAVGDIDQDGRTDIIGANRELVNDSVYNVLVVMESPDSHAYPESLVWSLRYGYAMGGNAPSFITPDLDRDGRLEILLVSGSSWYGTGLWESAGDNLYELVWNRHYVGMLAPQFGDFDQDGLREFAGGWSITSVYENAFIGQDTYALVYSDTTGLANGVDGFSAQDIDQDGRPEFFICFHTPISEGFTLLMWEATGNNTFERTLVDERRMVVGHGSGRSKCGDLDGDGVDELVWALPLGFFVYKAVGNNRFEQVWEWWDDHGTSQCVITNIADMNGNGYNDLVYGGSGKTSVFEVEAVRVLHPDSGEEYVPGETCWVRWQTFTPPRCDSVSLFLLTDTIVPQGEWFWAMDTIVTGLAPTDTVYPWIVPDTTLNAAWIVAMAYGPGWQFDRSDSTFSIRPTGVEERKPLGAQRPMQVPTIVGGVLHIPQPADHQPPAAIALYNLAGGKVADLHPGENDIRHLAPGVYFVRDRTTARTTKIVTQH